MGRYRIKINDRVYELEVEKAEDAQASPACSHDFPQQSWPSGKGPFVQVIDPAAEKKTEMNDHTVTCPMPGTIIKVLCGTGDPVRKGQGLAVLEAMKMENEITAPRDGYVKECFVSEGSTVLGGAVLFEIDE